MILKFMGIIILGILIRFQIFRFYLIIEMNIFFNETYIHSSTRNEMIMPGFMQHILGQR